MTYTNRKIPQLLLLQLTTSVFLFSMLRCVSMEADFQWVARSRHNRYRAKHDAKPLMEEAELSDRAMRCAEYYADQGSIDHSCPYVNDAGENIWAQWGGRASPYSIATRSVESWYKEGSKYRYDGHQSGTGHFTQMVWQGSREIGFGAATQGRMSVAVALYSPAGNYIGEYNQNVKRPKR